MVHFRPVRANEGAAEHAQRWETVDGSRVDPDHIGDIGGCRAVNDTMAAHVQAVFGGARLIGRVDDSPAVVSSTWAWTCPDTGQELEVTIEFDCTDDFGDPNGLAVTVGTARS